MATRSRSGAQVCAPESERREWRTPIADVMHTEVLQVAPNDPVEAIVARLDGEPAGCAVVVLEGRPTGLITRSDLLRRAGPRAIDVMSTWILALHPSGDTQLAMALMAYEGVSHLVVITGEGALAGVVTANDLLVLMARSRGYVIPDPRGSSHRTSRVLR